MEIFYGLMMAALAVAAVVALLWDNAHAMREEPAASPGDVTTIPDDQLARLHRARFERMDGVL